MLFLFSVTGLALYGLLLLNYRAEGESGETYIKVGGNRVDAQLAGGIVVMVALVVSVFCLWRRLRRKGAS